MRNKKKGSPRNKSNNPPPPTSATEKSNIHNQPNAQPKVNDCRYVKQESPNVYVNIPPLEKEKWSLANKIALGMGIVTLALTVFTYLLFVKAAVQADQAVRAANSADSVFGETKKEFLLINEPFIEMGDIKLTINENQQIKVEYSIVNLSQYPLKIIDFREGTATRVTPPDYEKDFKSLAENDLEKVNKYIIKEYPTKLTYHDSLPTSPNRYAHIMSGEWSIYFSAYIIYLNLITKKRKAYEVTIQLGNVTSKQSSVRYLRNENYPLDK